MKLKQKLAIGLCVFYTFSVIGIALSMHFCGGKLASVAINTHKTSCKLCKKEPVNKKDDGCCKNTKVDIKVKDSHQTTASVKLAKLFATDLFLVPRFTAAAIFSPEKRLFFINKAPPFASKKAIYLLNCVFRN